MNLILRLSINIYILSGNITTQNGILNEKVFLLDTKTYTWVTNFQASSSSTPSSPINNHTKSLKSIKIFVGISIGVFVVIVVAAIAFFILKHRNPIIETPSIGIPSSDDYNQMRQNT